MSVFLELQIKLLEKERVELREEIIKLKLDKEALTKQLTLTDVSQQRERLIDFAEKVYRRIFFTWDKKTSEEVVDEYIKGNL